MYSYTRGNRTVPLETLGRAYYKSDFFRFGEDFSASLVQVRGPKPSREKMKETMEALMKFWSDNGRLPSVSEILAGKLLVGVHSRSPVTNRFKKLVENRYLVKTPHVAGCGKGNLGSHYSPSTHFLPAKIIILRTDDTEAEPPWLLYRKGFISKAVERDYFVLLLEKPTLGFTSGTKLLCQKSKIRGKAKWAVIRENGRLTLIQASGKGHIDAIVLEITTPA